MSSDAKPEAKKSGAVGWVRQKGVTQHSVHEAEAGESFENVGLIGDRNTYSAGNEDWPVVMLEDCLEVLIDYRGKTPEKTESGIPLITAKIIKSGRIETPTEFIAFDNYDGWMRRGIPKAGDVVLTVEAPLGEVAQLGSEKVALAQRVVTLRGKAGFLDSTYLLYLLQSEDAQDQLISRATGTTVLGIKQSELRKIPIKVPPLPVQQIIASTLKSLDDRITLLRETNATLEAIAQALFKSWFVDFDPVRAKMEDRQPEGMDAETAALFPDSLEDSELGPIPKGWRAGVVGDLSQLRKGTINPANYPDRIFEHFSLPAFDASQQPVIELGVEIKSNKTPVTEDAVLLSKLNPHIPRIWLPVSCGTNAVCSTEFLVLQSKGIGCKEFIYCMLSSPDFIARMQQLVTGTSNSHQRIKPDQVCLMSCVVPSAEVMHEFESVMGPVFTCVHENRLKVKTLTQLRDTLLPRLISGQLRLPEAQEKIEEALA